MVSAFAAAASAAIALFAVLSPDWRTKIQDSQRDLSRTINDRLTVEKQLRVAQDELKSKQSGLREIAAQRDARVAELERASKEIADSQRRNLVLEQQGRSFASQLTRSALRANLVRASENMPDPKRNGILVALYRSGDLEFRERHRPGEQKFVFQFDRTVYISRAADLPKFCELEPHLYLMAYSYSNGDVRDEPISRISSIPSSAELDLRESRVYQAVCAGMRSEAFGMPLDVLLEQREEPGAPKKTRHVYDNLLRIPDFNLQLVPDKVLGMPFEEAIARAFWTVARSDLYAVGAGSAPIKKVTGDPTKDALRSLLEHGVAWALDDRGVLIPLPLFQDGAEEGSRQELDAVDVQWFKYLERAKIQWPRKAEYKGDPETYDSPLMRGSHFEELLPRSSLVDLQRGEIDWNSKVDIYYREMICVANEFAVSLHYLSEVSAPQFLNCRARLKNIADNLDDLDEVERELGNSEKSSSKREAAGRPN